MDLGIVLDSNSREPLYEQIYEYVRNEIRAGRMRAGERLPSTRLLARNLHVARTTVELAYAQLEEEGYIGKRERSGTYVSRPEDFLTFSGEKTSAEERNPAGRNAVGEDGSAGANGLTENGTSVGGSCSTGEWNSSGEREMHGGRSRAESVPLQTGDKRAGDHAGLIDFSPRRIDMSAFPYPTWRRIMRGILTGNRADLFDRGDPQGDPELRETIAHYLHLSRGCRCTAEQIVIGAGNDYLLLLLSMIFESGRQIGMESPGYSRAAKILEAAHERIVLIPSGPAGLNVQALQEKDCNMAYVMPARQYPVGTVLSYPARVRLLHWAEGTEEETAAAAQRYIIEDDYDSQFRYRGRPIPSLQSEDKAGHVIYMGTFSKTIAPAIRVSYMILPERLLPLFHERAGVMACSVPRIDQAILNEFIRDGYYERYLNRMRKTYRLKHDLMLECLKPFEKQFDVQGEGAGLHLVLAMRKQQKAVCNDREACQTDQKDTDHPAEGNRTAAMSADGGDAEMMQSGRESHSAGNRKIEERLAEAARRAGVIVHPMNHLYLDGKLPEGQDTPPAFLLGFASLLEEEIGEGLLRLRRAWGI